jgi:hypothetical protein
LRVQLDGKTSQLATSRDQASTDLSIWQASPNTRVIDWSKTQELRSGKSAGQPRLKRFAVADNAALEVFDYPGAYAQRFDGVEAGSKQGPGHNQLHARVVRVMTGAKFPAALYLHGAPACGSPHCIVVVQGWTALLEALESTRQASIVVEL